jgi:repressor LexA
VTEHLFEKRLEILKYLARRSGESGAPPSVREIGSAVGLRSTQTVHHHLGRLERDGYLERLEDRARTPVLTEKGWGAVGDVPLLGRIAAGRGLEAVAMDDGAYSLTSELLFPPSGKRRYTLRVEGDSMTGARIEDGDLLIVEEDEFPPDGAVVVALLEGERVTVKRLHREGDLVRLKPQNGEHEDIVVPADRVRVQGRVLHVVHPPSR